ncbi:MAG: ribosome small subunit-dependent GTPase A [Gammaproteobacteria bacterium]|nr:ribosome small subunit-dependent GTPase A [Gammaproteobacteria bacterium]
MNRRRLSKQQQARITANQRHRLSGIENPVLDTEAGLSGNGLVVSHYGQMLDVEALDPGPSGKIIRCYQRANLPDLVTGDTVRWEKESGETGVILALAKRRNLFSRPGFTGKLKPVAANLDIVVIVVAAFPLPSINLIDRYLVAVASVGMQSVLVMNKVDLSGIEHSAGLDRLLSIYSSLGFPLAAVSAKTGQGMQVIKGLLRSKTAVMVGQSGVGKSSLLNRLGGAELTATGALSASHNQGTHITTTARLFHLAGFDLIDSPGIREFELGFVEDEKVVLGFPEIAAQAGMCKFRNCRHESETGCAVRQASIQGQVHPDRLRSYRQIVRSMEVWHRDK